MIAKSNDNKIRVLSLSYGKDSMACLGAIDQLGWALDRIITADVWATDDIEADLPEMVKFKKYADATILSRYGIIVEHFRSPFTYDDKFYTVVGEHRQSKNGWTGKIRGFPCACHGGWCNRDLKMHAIKLANASTKGAINYIGIAADEPERFGTFNDLVVSPLVAIGWTEKDCKNWCYQHKLLSPIYENSNRGGCWFCHNQSIEQLRQLYHNHSDLWDQLLKWDKDSPNSFRSNGVTVHDFDKRFKMEDMGLLDPNNRVYWENVRRYKI